MLDLDCLAWTWHGYGRLCVCLHAVGRSNQRPFREKPEPSKKRQKTNQLTRKRVPIIISQSQAQSIHRYHTDWTDWLRVARELGRCKTPREGGWCAFHYRYLSFLPGTLRSQGFCAFRITQTGSDPTRISHGGFSPVMMRVSILARRIANYRRDYIPLAAPLKCRFHFPHRPPRSDSIRFGNGGGKQIFRNMFFNGTTP